MPAPTKCSLGTFPDRLSCVIAFSALVLLGNGSPMLEPPPVAAGGDG